MPGARKRVAESGPQTVTISFAGYNRVWAAWIGDRLERRGHAVVYQRWDPQEGTPLADSLRALTLAPGPVLVILSTWYFQLGPRTQAEWHTALTEVVASEPGRFAAVSVTTDALPPATAVFAAADLTTVGEQEAERRVLARLGMPADPLPATAGTRKGPRFPNDPSDVWGGVPRRNTRFTGREPLLNDAYHALKSAEESARVVTLHGMSGVGKTQLAAEYVYRFGAEYDVVWWVAADKRAVCRQRLAQLAPELGLSTGVDYGERLRATRIALRKGDPYGRWLIVFDGADDPEEIWDLVPEGPGDVLITARNPDWAQHNSLLLEVPAYDRDESVSFVLRRAPRLTAREADRLAEALEDLPLLLDQTAGWLNDSDMTVDEYIALLEQEGIDEDVVRVSRDFPTPFRTSWSILLNRLRETVPEAVTLLRLCAFFAPGAIPVRLVRDLPADELPESLRGLVGNSVRWAAAINKLRQYAVVRAAGVGDREIHETMPEGLGAVPGDTLYMHRLVHQIIRQDMPQEEHDELIEVVRRALAAADPGQPTDSRMWPEYAEIVPHLKWADVLQTTSPAMHTLVLDCLQYMYYSGEYTPGITLSTRAMDAWKAQLGDTHPRIWDLTHNYANLLRAVGDYAHCEAIERTAVNYLRENHGASDLTHLRAAGSLAADLRGLGRYDEALTISYWVLDAYLDLLGEQDARTLNAQNNAAVSLRLLGRYQDALDLDMKTLIARRRLLKPRHRWSLFSEIHVSSDQRLLGRYNEAESLQAQSVRVHRFVLGSDNPQTLNAEHSLALALYRIGRRREAAELFTGVLERSERVLGEGHPDTLRFAAAQSCFAREHGDIDQAREISERVVDGYTLLLGAAHPFAVGTRSNQALIMRAVGERDQARELAEQALAGMRAAVGDDHPWTLGCAINASEMRSLRGDVESAAELSADTASRAAEALGRTHPLTLSARVAVAADLRTLGDRQAADKTEAEALEDLSSTLGPQHPHTMSARSRTRPYWDFEPQII
ncbi:FxSxx-COOH system tetratricopeptide repeat protein [Streptomyces sp. NRRL F-5126]|uniref:FxSxx-COOH system tetratricopeptide repeat protein n=1 Tax=Streptomyces sp. NRRL F-5126 TaxID=1463857 RepID=UPI0004CBF689|nr:FxSxx-COOH system tetratricopeptide repeat protein [Streptomyces sp. NRRL F-5126]